MPQSALQLYLADLTRFDALAAALDPAENTEELDALSDRLRLRWAALSESDRDAARAARGAATT